MTNWQTLILAGMTQKLEASETHLSHIMYYQTRMFNITEFLKSERQSALKWDETSILEIEYYLYLSNGGPLFLPNKIIHAFASTLNPSTLLQIFKDVHILLENLRYFFLCKNLDNFYGYLSVIKWN